MFLNLFGQKNVWKVKFIIAQSINRWIRYLIPLTKAKVCVPESLKNIANIKRDVLPSGLSQNILMLSRLQNSQKFYYDQKRL